MPSRGVLALLAACLAAPPAVGAARADRGDVAREAKDHFARGRREFDLAKFDAAIAEYMIAYNLRSDPALLYDIALCHRLSGHYELAVVYYKNYLELVPAADRRAEIEETVRALEQKLADARRRDGPVAQPKPPPRAPAKVSSRRGTIFAGVVLLAGGAALGASGGVGFGLAARAESDAVARQAMLHQPFDPSLESNGHTFDALWITSVVVGVVAAAVGIALIAYGRRPARGEAVQ